MLGSEKKKKKKMVQGLTQNYSTLIRLLSPTIVLLLMLFFLASKPYLAAMSDSHDICDLPMQPPDLGWSGLDSWC